MIGIFFAIIVNGKATLKRTDRYYYQVQGQMALAGVKWCDFVIFTFKNHTVERICFDCNFWDDIQTRLTRFFFPIHSSSINCMTLQSNCSVYVARLCFHI